MAGRLAGAVLALVLALVLVLVATATTARALQAPSAASCTTDTLLLRTPAAWIGTEVGTVSVNRGPIGLPTPVLRRLAQLVHRTSDERVVRNELSVAAGTMLDTTELLESVRRLRRTRVFGDVTVIGERCVGDPRTNLRVETNDSWSLRAAISSGQGGSLSRVSVSETNVLGTGRTVQVAIEALGDRSALSIGMTDPHLFDTRLLGSLSERTFTDGRAWVSNIRSREQSPTDAWRVLLSSYQLRRAGTSGTGTTAVASDITRRENVLLVQRRFLEVPRAVYALVLGVEDQYADVNVNQQGAMLGRAIERRQFTAPVIGLNRRSTTFGVVDWLVPNQRPAELPVGMESEFTVGVGHDAFTGKTLVHAEGWVGDATTFGSAGLLTGNVWWSGYFRANDSTSNRSIRGDVTATLGARHGLWQARVAAEQIHNPDPDVFALSTVDPVLRTLASSSRLAETAVVASLERSWHMYSGEAQWVLDGALFGSYSRRYRSLTAGSSAVGELGATVVGLGLRHYRRDPLLAATRLDVGRAVSRSNGLPDRWIISVTTTPWVTIGRSREQLRNPLR